MAAEKTVKNMSAADDNWWVQFKKQAALLSSLFTF